MADDPTPRLLGTSVPASAAVPVPEITRLDAISDDARWLLFTSTSDRWVTNDLNAAADVFLFDRTTSQFTLVSAALGGRSGNGASLAGGLSADASRIVFQSRASDLVATDILHADWDVFVRDPATGTNWLVSVNVSSENAVFDSATPGSPTQISTDGRFVIFRSPLPARTPSPLLTIENVCRRDLAEARTECLTTNLPTTLNAWWRLTGFAATPDAQKLVVTASAAAGVSNLVAWKDLTSGQWVNCTAELPPELAVSKSPTHSAPAISANGRFVAFHSEVTLSMPFKHIRHALSLHDVQQGTTTVLCLRTNGPLVQDPQIPSGALRAQFSADGSFIAYATPTPGDPAVHPSLRTNVPSQVYLYDGPTQTTRLVSAAPDGVTYADADAVEPRLTPDGRGVAFLSRATNLLAGLDGGQLRAFWYERETGALSVIASLGDLRPDAASLVLSPNGDWLALCAPGEAGATTIHLFDTRNQTASTLSLVPQISESSTARGWIGVRPEGVSADGRYVALTAFPPAPAGDTNHMQVYLLDTLRGTRQLLTQGVDGHLANGHPRPPALSAGGEQVLFVSAATNLVANDTNDLDDVFLQSIATGQRKVLRADPVPASVSAMEDAWLSPNGSAVLTGFNAKSLPFYRWYLANPNTGAFSAIIPGTLLNTPSFSGDGTRVALNLSAKTPETDARVEIHEPAAWLAAGGTAVPALWTSSAPAQMPVLSADGSRVAFLVKPDFQSSSNALYVVDLVRKETVFGRYLARTALTTPALSADGRYVVFLNPATLSDSVNQVWRADVDAGTVEFASLAPDGQSVGNATSWAPTISADGRFVAFVSNTTNLVPGDNNRAQDVFLRDMQTHQTLLLSRTPAGAAGNGWSLQPFFSANGNSLFFLSHAPDLAPGDYNQAGDLFKVEIVPGSDLLVVIQWNLSTGQAELLWNGQPGKLYRLEFKDELSAPTWQVIPGAFAGGTPVEVSATANPSRFFRVVEAQ